MDPTGGLTLERVECPLCGGRRTAPTVTTTDLTCGVPGQFTFEACRDRGHVFLNPRPDRATIHRAYPTVYSNHQPTGEAATAVPHRPWYARPPSRWIPGLKQLYHWLAADPGAFVPTPPHANAKALEVGRGTGQYLVKLALQGWDAEGYEPASQAVEIARLSGARVHQGGVDDIQCDSDSLDAVIAWMVLEHLHDPVVAIRSLSDLLHDGGVLYLSVPNYGSWERAFFGRHWIAHEVPRHLHHFTSRRLRRMLHDAGFESVNVIHQHNVRNIFGSLGAWLRSVRPGSRMGAVLLECFTKDPPLWRHLACAPVAKVLAMLRQGGRLTIVARKVDRKSPQKRLP